MAYFPMFINLENKKVIVLGGGKTALRKINSLIKFDCKICRDVNLWWLPRMMLH